MELSIVDYGMGNIGSIANMFLKVGVKTKLAREPSDIQEATAIVLPGVGAFDHGMQRLAETGLGDALQQRVLQDRIPVLGICLGMQLMTQGSEEGSLPGLGWIEGVCRKFRFENGSDLKVPHMGWNTATPRKPSALFPADGPPSRFYFVHSYRLVETNAADVLTTTTHGQPFVSGFQRENIIGFQFHPEKSHRYGIQLFRNFAEHIVSCG